MRKNIALLLTVTTMCFCLAACGDRHEHTFTEATCTTPKTCSECGEIEGEALGHLVDAGVCSQCNTIVNEELITEVMAYIGVATEASNATVKLVSDSDTTSVDTLYEDIIEIQEYLNTFRDNMQQAYDLCGDYEGLKDLKAAVGNGIESVPAELTESDLDLEVQWLTEYQTFAGTMANTFVAVADFANGLSQASN